MRFGDATNGSQFPLEDLLSDYGRRAKDTIVSETKVKIRDFDRIPDTDQIQYQNPLKWARVRGVTCLFIDMADSSKLDYSNHAPRVCQIYQSFTDTLARVYGRFGASYVDIKGDGAFALFDTDSSEPQALITAVTFRTFVEKDLAELVKQETNGKVQLRARYGITKGDVIFKRMGIHGDKKNEVWTNSTVNNCFRLTSAGVPDSVYVTSEVLSGFRDHRCIMKSCGCDGRGNAIGLVRELWESVDDLGLDHLGIHTAHRLDSVWCEVHGQKFISTIVDDFEISI